MILRRRVGLLRRADAGSLALNLSPARSLSRRVIQRLGARQIFRLVDHRPIQVGYGSGTRSLVWRVVRQPAMGGALAHLSRATRRPPVDSIIPSAPFAAESPVPQVGTTDTTEIRSVFAPVSDRDVAPVTPRSQRVQGPAPPRSGRRPMKQTAVELPVQPQASAADEDRLLSEGDSLPEGPSDDGLAPRRVEPEADLPDRREQDAPDHVGPEGVVAPLPDDHRPDRETVPEPVDMTTVVSTEAEVPSPSLPPPPSLSSQDAVTLEMPRLDAELTAEPAVDVALTEGAGIPTSRGPTDEVAEKPPGPSPGLSRPVPLVSPAPLPKALRMAAGPGRAQRVAPEPPRRPLIRSRTETPGRLVGRKSEVAPVPPTAVMRQPVSGRVEVEIEQSLTPEESGPPDQDMVAGQAVERGETDEIRTTSLRAKPETARALRTEEETKSVPRHPGAEDMPFSSPPVSASPPAAIKHPVGPMPGTQDRPTARPDYAPTASAGMATVQRTISTPEPLVSRERLTGEAQAGPTDSSPEELLDPTVMWAAPAVRDLPLAGAADSSTVSLARAGTGEAPEVAKAGQPGVRLERLLGFGVDEPSGRGQSLDLSTVVQRAPAARTISRQETAAADVGGSEGAEATAASEGNGGGTEPAGEEAAVDMDKMAREVYQLLCRRLRVEQERTRGWIG